jgi:hypothetical protein
MDTFFAALLLFTSGLPESRLLESKVLNLEHFVMAQTSPSPAETPIAPNQSLIGLRYQSSSLPDGVNLQGGWLIGQLSAPPIYAVSVVTQGTQPMLWFEQVVAANASGVTSEVLDVISLPNLSDSEELVGTGGECQQNGVTDPEVIAIAHYTETEFLTEISQAWRTNRSTGKFETVSPVEVRCQNPGFGR